MKHLIPIFSALMLAIMPLNAANAQTQLQRLVAEDLRRYAPDVDVTQLSNAQLSRLFLLLNNNKERGGKRRLIRSALRGGITLGQ